MFFLCSGRKKQTNLTAYNILAYRWALDVFITTRRVNGAPTGDGDSLLPSLLTVIGCSLGIPFLGCLSSPSALFSLLHHQHFPPLVVPPTWVAARPWCWSLRWWVCNTSQEPGGWHLLSTQNSTPGYFTLGSDWWTDRRTAKRHRMAANFPPQWAGNHLLCKVVSMFKEHYRIQFSTILCLQFQLSGHGCRHSRKLREEERMLSLAATGRGGHEHLP